jgi:hypothetical protein
MGAKWTFMVYMAGNNSLSGAASVDLAELRKVGATGTVQVAAFIKRRGKDAVQRLVAKSADADVMETLPAATDSGSPQTVLDFARWAIERAPADRYALVLWNHGGGWSPDDFDELYQKTRGGHRDRHESNRLSARKLKRSLFRPSVEEVLKIGNANTRAICSDDVSGHSLDTVEVGRIAASLVQQIGKPLDLFGMDACLMSTLEVAYQIRKQARVVVGSEELEPGAGWKYDAILTALNAKPDMDGAALAKVVVQTYVDSYKTARAEWPVTQCAVDAAKCDDFAATLDKLVTAVRPKLATLWTDLFKAQARAGTFEFEMVDLRSLCSALVASSADPEIKSAAEEVIGALTPTPGSYVLAEGHLGPTVETCGGVSVYLPSPVRSEISPYYKDLDFAKKHHWDELLKDYFKAVRQ